MVLLFNQVEQYIQVIYDKGRLRQGDKKGGERSKTGESLPVSSRRGRSEAGRVVVVAISKREREGARGEGGRCLNGESRPRRTKVEARTSESLLDPSRSRSENARAQEERAGVA